MERERYGLDTSRERLDASMMLDDIERIRSREDEEEKVQNDKLSFAGLMAVLAGIGLVATGIFGGLITGGAVEFLNVALRVVGFGALGYGFLKVLRMAFRSRLLNFPTINIYRKTQARPQPAYANTQRGSQTYQPVNYRRRSSGAQEYNRSGAKGPLRRSRRSRVFAGVAGGISEYTGVPVGLIRFALFASMFMTSGFMAFVYLLLAIILPQDFDDDTPNRS